MSDLNNILNELLINIQRTHPQDFRPVFHSLSLILTNIIQHPQEKMYRYISTQSANIQSIFSLIPETINLLLTIGYTKMNNNYYIYDKNYLEPIKQCIFLINNILSGYYPLKKANTQNYKMNNIYNKNLPLKIQNNNNINNNRVIVYLYDLTQGFIPELSLLLLGKQINGIWHTGICVFGYEYYYGGGIQRTSPKKSPYGLPVKEIDFGFTMKSKESFEQYLKSINNEFKKENYNLLTHNCNHFTDASLMYLTGKHLPEKILKQHKEILNSPTGQLIKPIIEQVIININKVSNALLPILIEGNQNNINTNANTNINANINRNIVRNNTMNYNNNVNMVNYGVNRNQITPYYSK